MFPAHFAQDAQPSGRPDSLARRRFAHWWPISVLTVLAFSGVAFGQPTISATYRVGQIPSEITIYPDQPIGLLIQPAASGAAVTANTSNYPTTNRGSLSATSVQGNVQFNYRVAAGDREFTVTFSSTLPNQSAVSQTITIRPLTFSRPEADYIPAAPVLPDDATYLKYLETSSPSGRNVEISGRTVILEPGAKEFEAIAYAPPGRNGDVASLKIYGDTVVIRGHLWVPSAAVLIYARELRFEPPTKPADDPESYLKVAGKDADSRPAEQFKDGAPGANAGSIELHARQVISVNQQYAVFYLQGGRGQDAGPGRNGVNGISRGLSPAFGPTLTAPGRDYTCSLGEDCRASCSVNFTVPRPSQTFWVDFDCDGRVSALQTGAPDWPVAAVPATSPGRPGRGGDGGPFTAFLENDDLTNGAYFAAGGSGSVAPTASGAQAPLPNPAIRIRIACSVERNFYGSPTKYNCQAITETTSYSNQPSIPGPPALGIPKAGTSTVNRDSAISWLHPIVGRIALNYIRDVYRSGNLALAKSLAEEYYPRFSQLAASANPNRGDFAQLQLESQQLLSRISGNLDVHGNPAGWTPLLSLGANIQLVENEVKDSASLLYLSYWMENYANDFAKSEQAANATQALLAANIRNAQASYRSAVGNLPNLQTQVLSLQRDIDNYRSLLAARSRTLNEQATQGVMDRNKLTDWQKALRILSVVATSVPIGQPQLGAVGKGIDFATKVNPDDPIGAVQGALNLGATFAGDQFKQANDALSSPLAALGPEAAVAGAALSGISDGLTKMSGAIDTIRQTLGPPAAPQNEIDAELARIQALDPQFQDLIQQIKQVNDKKMAVIKSVTALTDQMSQASQTIAADLQTLAEIDKARQSRVKAFDLRGVNMVRAMGRRAQERLQKYLYYMSKSYEYALLKPYPGELNMANVTTRLQDLARSANYTEASADLVIEPYRQAIREVVSAGVDNFTNRGVPSKNTTSFVLTQAELDQLNANREVIVDLSTKLLTFGPNEEKRISNIMISPTAADGFQVAPSSPQRPISINFWTTGDSVVTSTANITAAKQFSYAFRFGTVENAEPFNWQDVWDPSRGAAALSHSQPSAQSLELLKKLVNGNLGVSDQNLADFFFAYPSADSLLRIGRSEGGGQIKAMRINVDITSYSANTRYGLVNVLAPTLGSPTVALDQADLTGRMAGRGHFKRVYPRGTAITLTADATHAGMNFDRWVNIDGQELSRSASLKLTLNDFTTVQPLYTAPQVTPQTISISGTITDPKGACAAGVQVFVSESVSTTSAADGKYTLAKLNPGSYLVIPSKAGCTFSPSSFSVNSATTDRTGVDFTGAAAPVNITLAPGALPSGFALTPYSATITATGGAAPYSFSIVTGQLPDGLSLNASGVITGTPAHQQSTVFTVAAKDANNILGQKEFSINIAPASTQNPNAKLISGVNANAIAVGAEGSAYIVTQSACNPAVGCGLAKWDGAKFQEWAGGATRIAVDSKGTLSLVNGAGQLWRYRGPNDQGSDPTNAGATDLAIGADGTTYVVGSTGCDATGCAPVRVDGNNLQPIAGTAARIAVDPNGVLWALRKDNAIRRYQARGSQSADAIPGTATAIAASPDGAIYVVGTSPCDSNGCTVYRYNGGGFTAIDGLTAVEIAAAPKGVLWLTTRRGEVYRYGVFNISGTVSDPSGKCSAGVTVSVDQKTFATTGDNGKFSLENMPAGMYTLTPSKVGCTFNPPSLTFNVAADSDIASFIGSSGVVTPITLGPASLPDATRGVSYSAQLTATGGSLPYTFVAATNLPQGLTLTVGGLLNGVPTVAGPASFTIAVTDRNGASGQARFDLKIVESASLPVITGVLNGASFASGTIAPGSWVSIFGSNMAPAGVSRLWRSSEFVNGKFPTNLEGTTVTVNGKPAAIEFIQPNQLNIQPPDDNATGTVAVVVTTPAGSSQPFFVNLAPTAPGFFSYTQPYLIAQHPDYSLVTPSAPARRGELIILWGTGFGPANPPVPAGIITSGVSRLANPVTVRIGGQSAIVEFVGLVGPGLVQMNVRVPAGAPAGNNAVEATVGGIPTQTTNNMISVTN